MSLLDSDPDTTNRLEPMPQAPDKNPVRHADGTTAITNKQDGSSGAYVSTKDATVKVNDGTIDVIKLGLQSDGSYAFQFSDDTVPRLLMDADSMKISQPGYDVTTATDDQLIFNSDQNMFKIVTTNTATITKAANASNGTTTIAHGLSYTPIVTAYINDGGLYRMLPHFSLLDDGTSSMKILRAYRAWSDATNIYLSETTASTGSAYTNTDSVDVRYYLLQETAN